MRPDLAITLVTEGHYLLEQQQVSQSEGGVLSRQTMRGLGPYPSVVHTWLRLASLHGPIWKHSKKETATSWLMSTIKNTHDVIGNR
jgi:hypothetical protein